MKNLLNSAKNLQNLTRQSTKKIIYTPYNHFSIKRALCSDPIDPICRQTFEKYGWTVTELEKSVPEDKLLEIIPQYEALVVRSGTTVTEKILEAGKNLKFVGRAGTGVDNIDLTAATNRGIIVMNTPGGNTVSTAEHTMSLMLSLARNVPQGDKSLKEAKWMRKYLNGVELQGKTIGVVGLGKIGQLVANWCRAFGMRVIGFDPVLNDESCRKMNIDPVELTELFEHSDYITVHTPLNDRTRNLLNDETLKLCKKGVRLINCARGGIYNEQTLLNGLNSGHIAGVALDVFTQEPPQELQMELINHPKVVSTPHLGASTEEAQIKVAKNIAKQIEDGYQGSHLFGVVNAPKGYEHSLNVAYKPYIELGDKLGMLQAYFMDQSFKINEVVISLHGEKLQKSASVLVNSVLKGLLNNLEDDANYNLMNAMGRAKEIGLNVTEKFEAEHPATTNALEIKFIGEQNGKPVQRSILGSCYGENKDPYLIQMDDYELFLPLQGNVLFYFNTNQVGVLSNTTNILANNDINIENLYLGRTKTNKQALTAIQVQETVNRNVITKLQNNKNVNSLHQVSFTGKHFHNFSTQPSRRPNNPNFSSGPCSKHPEYDLVKLAHKDSMKILGRSHRSKLGKSRIEHALSKTKDLLGLPEDYRVGLVPASDTGAVEMSLWSMLGPRPVDCAYWESFGKGWYQDIKNHLKIEANDLGTDNYGTLPDLSKVNPENDLVFAYNGTTSGVKVPNLDFISSDRKGITIADCTSAIFAQSLTPYEKLDVITYSWQKVLGGEGAHGILILSPRAVERLESHTPQWPVPKIFRMTKKGKLDEALFKHSPINTPSMLCIEDYIDSLEWVERIGGLPAVQAKSNANLKVVENFVEKNNNWIDFLCQDKSIRSNTSVCLTLKASNDEIKQITALLEKEGVAFDIGGYRDAPPSLRLWCGSTVQAEDLEIGLEWIKYAFETVKSP